MFNIREAMDFYCLASLERLEGRTETREVFGNPLASACVFERGKWKYVFSRSCVGEIAVESVILWLDGQPVWGMKLDGAGECGKFVAAAVLAKVKKNEFYGGRGPELFEDETFPGYSYRNTFLGNKNNFTGFFGMEEVFLDGRRQGYRRFAGGTWKVGED